MINYNNKVFSSINNSRTGDVTNDTVFHYRQSNNIVSANYYGGNVLSGHLIALADINGILDMRYHHININNKLMTGKCISTPEILENGKIRLHENWQWTNGDKSKGQSIIEEV